MANVVDSVLLGKSRLPVAGAAVGEGLVVGRHYTLHTKIGVGGMASVYLGWLAGAADFSRVVAIKRMHPQFALDEHFVTRFQDEARLSARLSHPNIVQVFDVVEQNRELLIVMEYVHGVALGSLAKDAIERGRCLPASVIAGVLVPALRGLHAVHEATDDDGRPIGIVHRDFSPQNIMVTSDGHAKVLDFGIAKARTHAHITSAGGFSGKVGYCSPEQIASGILDKRTDVFAAGIVLWEMLVGQRLFHAAGMSEVEAMRRVLDEPIRPPSSINPDVPSKLDKVVMHALERAPERRCASARELAFEIEAAIDVAGPSTVADWLTRVSSARMDKRARMLSGTRRRMARARLGLVSAATADAQQALAGPASQPGEPSVVTAVERPAPVVIHTRGMSRPVGIVVIALVLASAIVFGRWLLRPSPVAPTIPEASSGSARRHAPTVARVPDLPSRAETAPAPSQAVVSAVASAGAQAGRGDKASKQPEKHAGKRHPPARIAPGPARTATKAPSRPNCDPPTYLDGDGIRVFKEECL